MNSSAINQGSEWRKWDLHVHSPASHGYSGSWEQFEEQLKNSACDVIGINDYFSVEGYKTIKKKIEANDLDIGHRKILPVVEFRMRDVLKNKHTGQSGTNINFHVIFNDSIPIAKIETFIKSLEVEDSQIADRYENSQFLKETAKVYSETDIIDKLESNPDFKEKFIVWLPYDEYGGIDEIDPETDDWIKRGFINKSHVLGSSNKKQIDFFLWHSQLNEHGQPRFSQEQFREWFHTKKPSIKGSDSHKHDYPIGKLKNENSEAIEKYCWIKAEPTFEGLKQIIYDPESRVFIGEKKPIQPTNVIDSITLNVQQDARITVKQNNGMEKEDVFCFANIQKTFYLSPFFNCFIGGRGSGKSTVLNFLGQHSTDPNSSKAFWTEIQPSFDITDTNIFSFSGVDRFEFIGQSEVNSFATNKEAFTNAIYERANILSNALLDEAKIKLETYLEKIEMFLPLLETLDELTEEQRIKEKDRKILEDSVKITKSQEYSDIIDKITKNSNQKQELERWRTTIDELRNSVVNLQEQYFSALNEEESKEDATVVTGKEQGSEENIAQLYQEAYHRAQANIKAVKDVLAEKKFIDLVQQEDKLSKEIEGHEKELSQLLRKAGLSEENILQVKSAPQKLIKTEDELSKIKKSIDDTSNNLNKYDDIIKEAQTLKEEFEKQIHDSIKPLETKLEEQAQENDKEDIKNIGLIYFFDEQQAWKDIADKFYSYFSEQYKDSEKPANLKDYIIKNEAIFANSQSDIKDLLEREGKAQEYIKFLKAVFSNDINYRSFQVIRDQHLNDVSKYKRIQVLYDNKDIEHASFGQKCTAVIVILLLFGNYPLIIDEPEAHLDSSLIANYLVPLIKKNKTNRQIIFATHNANFVVNGDSEKIFILKNDTGITEFVETTIENLNNRVELLKLEGGKEAFQKRGEKLSIK